jgi:hypothetical protein
MSHQQGNISAGTQVVSLIEIRGTNNSLVHPRGAVGVVTRTPAVKGENFLVRFPDGFEKSLERSQLEVLKHFKDRIGVDGQEKIVSDSGFDLENCIIYRCVVGSRAYGLDTDESDTDRRGVYLAPAESQWSLFGAPEQFEDNADQSCYWELQKFIVMALRANPNILECLYSPIVEKVMPLGEELLNLRHQFLSPKAFGEQISIEKQKAALKSAEVDIQLKVGPIIELIHTVPEANQNLTAPDIEDDDEDEDDDKPVPFKAEGWENDVTSPKFWNGFFSGFGVLVLIIIVVGAVIIFLTKE